MNYLYHWVPENMRGSVLYPLNMLKKIYPEIYKKNSKKYEGRKFVMEYKIKPLNCFWNDAIHLSAVDPLLIKNAYEECGGSFTRMRFYRINTDLLDKKNTTVYLYKYNESENEADDRNWKNFDIKDISSYSILSDETKNYYCKSLANGKRPLLYHLVPHILYKGTIDISNTEVIEL